MESKLLLGNGASFVSRYKGVLGIRSWANLTNEINAASARLIKFES